MLRTIALIFLVYFGIKVVMRLFSSVKKDGKNQAQNSTKTNAKQNSKKPNYGNTEIEDADFEEIK